MRRLLVGTLCIIMIIMPMKDCFALFGLGDVVHDPLHNATSLLTAARSYTSNVNEVAQLNNQVRQLANEARQLMTLPFSVIGDIQRTMTAFQQLFNMASMLSFQLKASQEAFTRLFDSSLPFQQRAQGMLSQIRNAGYITTSVQAIYDQLCLTTSLTERLVNASQASQGQLQATQAGNQLVALQIQQQQMQAALAAANGRLQTMQTMYMQQAEVAAQKNGQAWMADYPPARTMSFTSGKGPQLPQ